MVITSVSSAFWTVRGTMGTICRSNLEFAALRTDKKYLMLTGCKSEERAEHVGYDIGDLESFGGAVHGLQGPTHVQVRRCRATLPDGVLDRIKLLDSFQHSIPWHLEGRHSSGPLLGAADSFMEPVLMFCNVPVYKVAVQVSTIWYSTQRRADKTLGKLCKVACLCFTL